MSTAIPDLPGCVALFADTDPEVVDRVSALEGRLPDLTRSTRAALIAALAGITPAAGMVAKAAGLEWRYDGISTYVPNMPGWVPAGIRTPQHYGAVGDGVHDDRPAFVALDTVGDAFVPPPLVKYTLSAPYRITKAALSIDPAIKWMDLTDGGKLTFWRSRATDSITNGSNIHRLSDRVFVGYAATAWAGNTHVTDDAGGCWLAQSATSPSYLAKNAGLLYMSGPGVGYDGQPASHVVPDRCHASRNSSLS